jgi:hypothetical protein
MDVEYLREHIDYDPDTGLFEWRQSRRGIRPDNRSAGYLAPDGRWYVTIDYHRYLAHRLAWFYVHGRWPAVSIDHIDGNPSNNRLSNLREATLGQNQQNRRAGCGTSRFLGVHWDTRRQRWLATIKLNRKSRYLGQFLTEEAAAEAYVEAKRRLHEFGTL